MFQFALIRKLSPWNAEDPQNLTKDLNCFEQNSNSRLTVYRPPCNSLGQVASDYWYCEFCPLLNFWVSRVTTIPLLCENLICNKKKIWTKLQIWYDCVSATMQQLGPDCLTTTTVSFALFSTLGRFWTHFTKTDWLCIGHHATARAELPDYYYCEFCPLLNFWQTGDWHPYSLVANFRIGF